MNAFFETACRFSPLSDATRAAVAAVLQRHELPKGHLLVKPEKVCNHLYLIEQGLSRTFYYKDGKDVTDWISTEGTFAVSIVSFITRQPDRRLIELLEPSIVWYISYDDFERCCTSFHDFERLGRQLAALGVVQLQRKFDDYHFATAVERYQKLITTNPGLLQRVPLGIIASFLGMSQETLSRIRGQRF